jgi:pyruvate/2-oxoglutarate dehydrogenase complex dihydrolipoamide dehydrogenase (E3) component
MAEQQYDVAIIGAGQAAVPLSFDLARAGRSVVVIERKNLGGSCVNFGCTPSKAAIASARVAHQIRRAAEYGLKTGLLEVDFAAVMQRANAIVEDDRRGVSEGPR